MRHAERLTGRPIDPAARDPLVDILTEASTVLREQRDANLALVRRQRRVIRRLLAAIRRRDERR